MFGFLINSSSILSIFLVDTINDTEDFSGCKLKFAVMLVAEEDSLQITQFSNSPIHQLLAFPSANPGSRFHTWINCISLLKEIATELTCIKLFFFVLQNETKAVFKILIALKYFSKYYFKSQFLSLVICIFTIHTAKRSSMGRTYCSFRHYCNQKVVVKNVEPAITYNKILPFVE